MNPTEQEVAEMKKDVDPNDSGSFDQMSLISLIARKPKSNEALEEMIEAIKTLCQEQVVNDEDKNRDGPKQLKINVEQIKFYMSTSGEKMQDHEIEEILADCADLQHNEEIIVDDFANYLMSR